MCYSIIMRGRPPSISEKAILDAALDVFRKRGHAATTAEIARRAAVSEGILFYRYKNKEALFAAVLHREAEPPQRLRDLAKQAGRGTVAKNLQLIIEALLDSVSRVHPLFELAETSAASSTIRKALFARPGKPPPVVAIELVATYLNEEIRLGRIRKLGPIPVARVIFGGCVEYVRGQQFGGEACDARTFARELADVLLNGVVSRDRRQ